MLFFYIFFGGGHFLYNLGPTVQLGHFEMPRAVPNFGPRVRQHSHGTWLECSDAPQLGRRGAASFCLLVLGRVSLCLEQCCLIFYINRCWLLGPISNLPLNFRLQSMWIKLSVWGIITILTILTYSYIYIYVYIILTDYIYIIIYIYICIYIDILYIYIYIY